MYPKPSVNDDRFGHDDEGWCYFCWQKNGMVGQPPDGPVVPSTGSGSRPRLIVRFRLFGRSSSGEGDSANDGSVSIIDSRWYVARRNLAESTLGQGSFGRYASHGHESWRPLLPEAIRVLTAHHRSSPDLSTPLLNPTRICCGTIPRFRQIFRLIPVPSPPLQCLAAPTSNPS